MSGTKIKGLLFDKDGTLFDFQATWGAVVESTLCALSDDVDVLDRMSDAVGFDRGTCRFVPGAPSVAASVGEIAEILATFLPHMDVVAIERRCNEIASDAVADGGLVPAAPDLPQLLGGMLSDGYVLGVATHDSERAAREQLQIVGADQPFSFIAGYDSGYGLKPGPGMLLAFAAATGLQPSEIAMIGDSVHDLGMAPAAGAALAVGVLTGPADAADLEHLADHIIPSIADLPALLHRI